VAISDGAVSISRFGGLQIADFAVSEPIVATMQVGCRGPEYIAAPAEVIALPNTLPISSPSNGVVSISVLPPDAATMDLSEAPRIVGGGAGLRTAEAFSMLEQVATVLDASMGVTRVITDRSWVSHERQIGTTGVVVNPRLYISFGISGAVQHTSGLGQPDHIISVNTDPHCPMMQMSDLAIVSDANIVLEELAGLLDVERSSESVNRAS
jgi:electron transfer flavoprotein alpha subunit